MRGTFVPSVNLKTTCFTYWGECFLVRYFTFIFVSVLSVAFPPRPCRLSAFTSKGPPQNSVPLELVFLREQTFLAYSVRTWKGRSFSQICKKPTFPFLSLSPLSARVKLSEVLSDDVTVIVEIKECEGAGFSSSKHRFSKPASIYGGKEKMVPSSSLREWYFLPNMPCMKAWHSAMQPLNATGCLCLVTLLYSCIYWQIGHKIAANCATRKFQQCNLNPRGCITKQRCLFFLNMRIINGIRQQSYVNANRYNFNFQEVVIERYIIFVYGSMMWVCIIRDHFAWHERI